MNLNKRNAALSKMRICYIPYWQKDEAWAKPLKKLF